MNNLTRFLSTFLLLIAGTTAAQPNQYAEFQRSISNARSNAAYIEAIESAARTPNARWQPAGTDKQAIQELTDSWKKDPGTGAGMRRWSTSDLAAINAQAVINERAATAEKARAEGRAAVTVPLYRDLMAGGLSAPDAGRIIDLGINKDGTTGKHFYTLYLISYHYKTFKEQAQKAPFTDLLSLVLQYEILPAAALSSLDILEERFPGQQYVVDMTRLKVLPQFFSGMFLDGNYTSAYASNSDKVTLDRMSDLFFSLSAKYPEASSNFLRLCDDHYNPYVTRIKLLQEDKKTHKEARELILQYLNMPSDNFMAALAATHGEYYLLDMNVAGYEKLAKIQKVHPMDLLFGEPIAGIGYRYWMKYWPSGRGDYFDFLSEQKRQRQLIKEFAEAGYPDAQNLYGVRIGLGFEKKVDRKDALMWLQKAAAGGNKPAVENLKTICQKPIKGIEDFCKQK